MAALWLLNLDADLEFAALQQGRVYQPGADVQRVTRAARETGLGLLAPGDRVLHPEDHRLGDPQQWEGRAFCPSPLAARRFASLGVAPEPWPELNVVRRVNGRKFASESGLGPELGRYWENAGDLIAWLQTRPAQEDWLAKREHGVAGKGQRPLRCAAIDVADHSWIQASMPMGGLAVEPRRHLLAEYSLHGMLGQQGDLVSGTPVRLQVQQRAFENADLAPSGDLTAEESEALHRALRGAARALREARYFGPFGIDAYRWQSPAGGTCFEPCSEINARYTLAWALGMSNSAQGLAQNLDEGGL